MSARSAALWFALSILGCGGAVEPADPVDPAAPTDPGEAPAPDPDAAVPVAGGDTGGTTEPAPVPRWKGKARKTPSDGSPTARQPAPATEPAPTVPKTRPIGPKPAGVNQVGERSWTVTRALVDKWEDDPYQLGNVRESGEGWELLGVRMRPAYHLGMRNGDILLEVNGHRLNTMVNLLATYASCRNDTKFDVLFLRKGTRVVHHYEIK